MTWRYLARRLNGDGTSTDLDVDLPLEDVSLTETLSGPDALSAKISPLNSRLLYSVDGRPLLEPYSTAIFAEESGSIRHGTILTSPLTRSGPDMSITGVGFTGYAANQPYQGDVYFIQKDPLYIVRHIWAYLQARPRGDIGLTLGSQVVGRLIGTEPKLVEFDAGDGPVSFEAGPYKLNWWQTDNLGGDIDTLAAETGFDYRERHAWNAAGTDINHYMDFGVPRIGRRRSDLRFVVGENVLTEPPVESSVYCSEVVVRGAGEGRTMVRGYASRAGDRRLALPVVVEDKSIKSKKAANARAGLELARRAGQYRVSEIKVIGREGMAPIGSWSVGDEVEIHTDGEWGPVSAYHRVLATTYTPGDLSAATLTVVRSDMVEA